MAEKLTNVTFEIVKENAVNEDGEARQDILKQAYYDGDSQITFNRGKVRSNGNQIIEVILNEKKVGELKDSDYIKYQTSIASAQEAFIRIYEQESKEGDYYIADAVITMPYNLTIEGRMAYQKRKKLVLLAMMAVFALSIIYSLLNGDMKTVIMGVAGEIVLAYWVFIRDPKKDDRVLRYLKTGRR